MNAKSTSNQPRLSSKSCILGKFYNVFNIRGPQTNIYSFDCIHRARKFVSCNNPSLWKIYLYSTIFMRQRQQFCKRDDIWRCYCLLHTIESNIYRLDSRVARCIDPTVGVTPFVTNNMADREQNQLNKNCCARWLIDSFRILPSPRIRFLS